MTAAGCGTAGGLGISARPIDPRILACEDNTWRARNRVDSLRRSIEVCVARAPYEVEDIRRAVGDEAPDVVLVDNKLLGRGAVLGAAVGTGRGVPAAAGQPGRAAVRARSQAVRTAAGRLRDTLIRTTAGGLLNLLLPQSTGCVPGWGCRRSGGSGTCTCRHRWCSATRRSRWSTPRTDLPAAVRLVGPGVWDPGSVEPEPSWLARLDRPVVLVTASTLYQNDARLIQTALDALADEPFSVMVTTASLDPAAFSRPGNARVERFLPHGDGAAASRGSGVHAGIGSPRRCWWRGCRCAWCCSGGTSLRCPAGSWRPVPRRTRWRGWSG